jgi:hypothetical protein
LPAAVPYMCSVVHRCDGQPKHCTQESEQQTDAAALNLLQRQTWQLTLWKGTTGVGQYRCIYARTQILSRIGGNSDMIIEASST